MKVLELKTVQTNAFKTLIEALKEILTDANMRFTQEGLKIVAMNNPNTVLVNLKLKAENFEYFYCKSDLIVGVSMLNFYKLIKTITNNDTLSLIIDDDNINFLEIKIDNSERNASTIYKLNLMDLDVVDIDIPPQKFDDIITISSQFFQKLCRDMINLAENVEIKSVGGQLIFKCVSDFATQETIIEETGAEGLNFVQNNPNNIIQGNYDLKNLSMFTKCTNLSNCIEIYMKNDFPLLLKANANLGHLILCISPLES